MHEDQRQKDMEQLINGIDGLLKQIPVNLYTKEHNKQIKPIKHGIWWLVFFSLVWLL